MDKYQQSVARCAKVAWVFQQQFPELRFEWRAERTIGHSTADVYFVRGCAVIIIRARKHPDRILIKTLIRLFKDKYRFLPKGIYDIVRKWLEQEASSYE